MRFSLLLSLFISVYSFAASNNTKWRELKPGERYKLSQEIKFEDSKFTIQKGTRLKLIESTPLNMIKVQLLRYQVANCEKQNLETDLELVPVKGNKDAAVGVNLSKGCILEVFVEKKDLGGESLLM